MHWFIAISIKLIAAPIIAFAYWMIVIRGGQTLVNSIVTSRKWRDFLTKDRYF